MSDSLFSFIDCACASLSFGKKGGKGGEPGLCKRFGLRPRGRLIGAFSTFRYRCLRRLRGSRVAAERLRGRPDRRRDLLQAAVRAAHPVAHKLFDLDVEPVVRLHHGTGRWSKKNRMIEPRGVFLELHRCSIMQPYVLPLRLIAELGQEILH